MKKEFLSFFIKQLIYAIIALVLLFFPFFVAKGNMVVHYIFGVLAFAVLLINLLRSKKILIPTVLLLAGIYFILGYTNQAKKLNDDNKEMQEMFMKWKRSQ